MHFLRDAEPETGEDRANSPLISADDDSVLPYFRNVALAAGIAPEKAHPHSLKHSRCMNLFAGGVNLMEVRQRVGHKSIGSTVKYISVSDQQAAQVAKRADAEIF